jgi:hypothetical protein
VWDVTERLYAAIADEEAMKLEACRQAVLTASKKFSYGGVLTDTEAGLDARTIYIETSRLGPNTPPSRPGGPISTQQTVHTGSGGVDTAPAPAKRQKAPAAPANGNPVTRFVCPKCGENKPWLIKGKDPWPGATCIDCYKAGKA